MKTAVVLLCIFCSVLISEQASTPEDDHYWAGVVEFSSAEKYTEPEADYTAFTVRKYIEIVNSPDADPVDILVFPESTMNYIFTASYVPDPKDKLVPCNVFGYEPVVRDLSCAAARRKKYLVINIVEKAACPGLDDTRPCSSNRLYHYNSNVVFDRNGAVIARYRKFNLFGEEGINTTVSAEVVKFDTDFGVTFGTFICFDLMFEQPALQLIRDGVTDIIFPTMWFSELPFLTAVQIQQAWAYKNNVNLLAAGASYPEVGSTGTGVYAGKRGRIVSVMNHNRETKLYVASVPKISKPQAELKVQPIIAYTPTQMNNLKLKRDQLDGYTTMDLPLTKPDSFQASVCQNRVCCNFTIDYTVGIPVGNQQFYRYKLAAYDKDRTFDGFADGQITACAIFACTTEALSSCGLRFTDTTNIVPLYTFNSIELTGSFPADDEIFLLPNSVDTRILPLEVDEFSYDEQRDAGSIKVQHNLLKSRTDLYSFGIWGRKFRMEQSGSVPVTVNSFLVLLLTACIVYLF